VAARRFALHQFVERDTEHPRDDFQESDAPAALPLAKVRGKRLGLLAGGSSASVVFRDQRRRKTFLRFTARNAAGARLAGDYRGDDAAFRMDPLEGFDLDVDPAGPGGCRRAQDQQAARGF
jgi:hypothetical protein